MMFRDFSNDCAPGSLGDFTWDYAEYIDNRLDVFRGTETYDEALEHARAINNFSIEQLDYMLGFIVLIGLVDDSYRISVVFEDCENGP